VQKDLDGLRVASQDHDVGQTTVEGLGGLVGSLPQLVVVQGLLQQVHNLGRELGIGQWECLRVHFLSLQKLGMLLTLFLIKGCSQLLTIFKLFV